MQKLAGQDYTEGFTTELTKIQEQILTFVEEMQPVCRKIVKLNGGSYAHSTIDENINTLLETGRLDTDGKGALVLP